MWPLKVSAVVECGCPVHATMAADDPPKFSRPVAGFGHAAKRAAERSQPGITGAFMGAMGDLSRRVDLDTLRSALAGGDLSQIQAAAQAGSVAPILQGNQPLFEAIKKTGAVSAEATAAITSEAAGVNFAFKASDPNTVLMARAQIQDFTWQIADEAKEAVSVITTAGAEFGLTPAQQAVAVQQNVGLPSTWASAPLNFGNELRNGVLNSRRLLDDPLVHLPASQRGKLAAEIQAKLAKGPLTEAEIAHYTKVYSENLLKRRALNIARTESMRAANGGQLLTWQQAVADGVLPRTSRRVIIVTPDEQLRQTHLDVARRHQDGVGMDQPFDTPWGRRMYPPWEPLCRCTVGLIFVQSTGATVGAAP